MQSGMGGDSLSNKVVSVILIIVGLINVSWAATVTTTIESLMIDRNNGDKVYIRVKSSPANSCTTNYSWNYVLDLSDDLGRTMYSSLLTAYAAKSAITFI